MTKTSEQQPKRSRSRSRSRREGPQSPAVPVARRNRPRKSPVVREESIGDLAGEAADEDDAPVRCPISVILSEPDVLDCSICYDPLTIPVYQCVNGHISCSSCCTNIRNRCPSCSEKIGDIRCRAFERVLESLKISCSYKSHGCQASLSYCSRLLHEETCVYAPCACPFQECAFRGSPRRLSFHLNQQHNGSVMRFCFNSVFSFPLKMADEFLVLQEGRDGILFILKYTNNNSMAIRCFGSSISGDNRFAYAIIVRRGNSSLRFQSLTEKAPEKLNSAPSVDFLQVPRYLFNSGGCVRLEICIWSKDASYADITRAIPYVQDAAFGKQCLVETNCDDLGPFCH